MECWALVKAGHRGYKRRLSSDGNTAVFARLEVIQVKFILVDQLLSHEPGKRLVMAKNVTMAEEYLADHFPGFPVLPGVMMLEAGIQTAAWLVRDYLNFAHSLIVLKEARGVRYGNFVSPGQTLVMTAEAVQITPEHSDIKVKGTVGNVTSIQARLELAHLNLAKDGDSALEKIDQLAISAQRERWQVFMQRPATALAG
jgi:3-hydroxyacyl-[acyl-carrier-protein] dehydratase